MNHSRVPTPRWGVGTTSLGPLVGGAHSRHRPLALPLRAARGEGTRVSASRRELAGRRRAGLRFDTEAAVSHIDRSVTGQLDVPEHRFLERGPFWRAVPGYTAINEATFLDPLWQAKNAITRPAQLVEIVGERLPTGFVADLERGLARAPMALRVTPHVVALVDWPRAFDDPVRRQHLPLASEQLPDHPRVRFDALAEQRDAPVRGLTHRYADRALFVATDTCPVYCRFCLRSYAVGTDTERVSKLRLGVEPERWSAAIEHVARTPAIEDVLVSGGDVYQLRAEHVRSLGEALLAIPHVRRVRYATKGLGVMPQKVLRDFAWTDALASVAARARRQLKEVCVHTHINHPREITGLTADATAMLRDRDVVVRNQAVLLRGVNDSPETLRLLVKRLVHVGMQPFYVHVHDLVPGVEDLRTSIARAATLEKHVRGATAGHDTPAFVVDLPGGGGKRDVHGPEHHDPTTGISVWTSPVVAPGRAFLFFDPLHALPSEGRERWAHTSEHDAMELEALRGAGLRFGPE